MSKNDGGIVKITGGKLRGRKISTPGGKTHPMGERERLALFNMIGPEIQGIKVLDAFAGSGALGIEALSRGASKVVFVDDSAMAIRVIKENLTVLGMDGETIKSKISGLASNFGSFDLILADPPYNEFDLSEVKCLGAFASKDGVLALSHPGEAPEIGGFTLMKTRQYAAAHLSLYIKD